MEIPEGFIAHEAGENPAPGKLVCVLYRDGSKSIPAKSEEFECLHKGKDYWKHELGGKYDIVAYRLLQANAVSGS